MAQFAKLFDEPLAIVDLETTGGNAARDRITEISIIAVDGGRLTGRWSTLVNPGVRIPYVIQKLTGIDDAMVREAPPFPDLVEEVWSRLAGRWFLAHNVRFDYGFLRTAFAGCDREFSLRQLCTAKLSRRLFPAYRRHNLDSLIERHGLQCDARHRATGDTEVLWQWLDGIVRTLDAALVDDAVAGVMKRPSLPLHLDEQLLDDLPQRPGVYRFLDERGAPLYIGKSRNLRSRVMDHFAAAAGHGREQRMAAMVRQVTWTETRTELEALLLEAAQIKQELPLFNRRLRRSNELCSWQWRGLERAPALVALDPSLLSGDHELLGLFRTRRQARESLRGLVKEAGLCLKLSGLEKGAGVCSAYQLKRCAGACAGEESAAAHGLRLYTALSRLERLTWPWAGAIGLQETMARGAEIVHVIDRWCYLGSAADEEEMQRMLDNRPEFLDLDHYRILHKAVTRAPKGRIRQLTPARPDPARSRDEPTPADP